VQSWAVVRDLAKEVGRLDEGSKTQFLESWSMMSLSWWQTSTLPDENLALGLVNERVEQ
jgi:hypothetical protein